MHRTTKRFWECFNKLPESVQKAAKEKFRLLTQDTEHPSLHFKKVGELWSVRVDVAHRALAVADDEDFIWVWIGGHDEYERLIPS